MRSQEISQILEIPPATVDTRVARARRMLRERLEEAEGELVEAL
jgi:DNA-directed RNA polymerase specialized sigma24 family protein